MITNEQVENKLRPLGFTVYCYDGNHNPTYMDSRGINIQVNLAKNSFRILYRVGTIFLLDSQNLSPFISDEYQQFEKMYGEFQRHYYKLQ